MTAALKTCGGCGNSFEARGRAAYCSRACRQRAWRDRTGGNRNETLRGGVTKAAERRAGHCAEALEVLAALDAELADAARQSERGWTAAESAVRELIARTIDRTTDLQQLYQDSDAKTRVKLSAESAVGGVDGAPVEAGQDENSGADVAAHAEGAERRTREMGP